MCAYWLAQASAYSSQRIAGSDHIPVSGRFHLAFGCCKSFILLLVCLPVQVMLAQQRTIIQLVQLVNVLHDEAMRVVASLAPCSQDGPRAQAHEDQEIVLQQRQQER